MGPSLTGISWSSEAEVEAGETADEDDDDNGRCCWSLSTDNFMLVVFRGGGYKLAGIKYRPLLLLQVP